MNKNIKINKEIVFYSDIFKIRVCVKNDLSPFLKEESLYGFGDIKSPMFPDIYWGNLKYFKNLNKKKKKSLKVDFPDTPPKGWFKELKLLIKEIKKSNYL